MTRTSLILLLWIPTTLLASTAMAQTRADKEPRENDERGTVEFTESELIWPAIDTHQAAKATIRGKEFKWQESFNDGESPYFDAMKHELKPGIYAYQIAYISNEIQEQAAAIKRVIAKRRELMAGFDEAVEAGDEEAVKALYWQANDVRNQLIEMQSQQRNRSAKPADDSDTADLPRRRQQTEPPTISRKGKFLVDEFGMIKNLDDQVLRELREAQREEYQKQNPRKFEEGHRKGSQRD